jgi:hypothetical protein
MAETAPSGRPLVPPAEAPVFQEVAQVDAYRRLNFLPRWTSRYDWLKHLKTKPVEVLLIMREPGIVRLLPWLPEGERLQRLYEEVAAQEEAEDQLESLRLIQDGYGRLLIDAEHRPYLGDAALAHLGLPLERGIRSSVYVVLYPRWISIMSQELRNAKTIQAGNGVLDAYPS